MVVLHFLVLLIFDVEFADLGGFWVEVGSLFEELVGAGLIDGLLELVKLTVVVFTLFSSISGRIETFLIASLLVYLVSLNIL